MDNCAEDKFCFEEPKECSPDPKLNDAAGFVDVADAKDGIFAAIAAKGFMFVYAPNPEVGAVSAAMTAPLSEDPSF